MLPQTQFLLLKADKHMVTKKGPRCGLKRIQLNDFPRLASAHVALKADQFNLKNFYFDGTF